jgi:phosphoserine phosphatase
MDQVVTLIAATTLDADAPAAARAALAKAGAQCGEADWLAPARACDLPFAGLDAPAAEGAIRTALGQAPVDVLAQPREGRRKALLLADMDSTIVHEESLDELASYVGLKDHIAAITARAMNGELDFKAAVRERVGLLKDLSTRAIEETVARLTLMEGAHSLVATMRANGAYAVLVSGGFTPFTKAVATLVGFQENHGNELEVQDGRLTGRVVEPIRDKDDKLKTLHRLVETRGIALADALTVGDGANDLPMLLAAGLGIAYRARPNVRAQARFRIDHGDLTSLLFAQGYRESEFVKAGP